MANEIIEEEQLDQQGPGPKYKVAKSALYDLNTTLRFKPNLTAEQIFKKFPEFNNDAQLLQSAMDYVATANSGKYKTEAEIDSKFPEFGFATTNAETEQRKSFMQTNPLSPLSALKKKQEVLPTPQERKAKETHAEDYPLNPMATIKRQTIKVGSETLPIETTFPGVKADEKLAKEIQHRVETGATTVEDARIVGNAMNISPLAANAILNGKINTGTAINIAEKKAEFSGKIKGLVEEANKALGLNDDYEQVTKNPQAVKAYLEKLEKGYAAKKQREIGRLDKAYERDFERIRSMGEMSAGDLPVGYTEAVQGISDANQNAYEALKGIFGSLLVQQINSDPKLSREQKVATIRTTLNPVKSKITDEVINERFSPFKYVKHEAMRYMFPWMKTTSEEIAPLEADKAQIELALTNDDKNNLFSANTQLGAIAENLQDKKNKGEQLTNEEAKALQSAATALQQRIATIEAGFVPEKEIFKKYPILLQQKVVQLVNDYNALKSGNIEGRGKMYENTTLEEHLAANDIDPNDQRIKDILANTPIKDYGTFGRPLTAAKNVISDAFSSIANLTGITDDLTALSSKATGELFPTEPGKNDEYRLKGGARAMHTIASTTGQVIGQGVLQLATAGAGKIAGLAPAVARNTAFATSGFLTQYDNSYKESFNFIENKVGRMVYAAANAGFSAAAEKMFPDMDVLKVPGTKEALVKIAQRVGTKDFTQAALKESLNDVGKTIIAFGKKYSKTTGQEVSEEDLTSLFHDVSNFVAGDKEMNVSAAIENLKETTIQTALGMSAIAGFSAVKDIRTERNVSPRLDLYNAALYHDAATDAINKGFADGKYSEAERDEKLSILTTAVQSLGALKKAEQAANTVLSRGKRGVYVSNLTAETILNKQIEANKNSPVPDAVLDEQLKSKVAALKEQRTQLLTDPTIDIEDDGDVVDLGEQKPYYKINGKDVSKAELLEAMNKPFDSDMELEAGNDAEVQERLEKIGGKTESLSNETTTTYIPKAGVSSNSNEDFKSQKPEAPVLNPDNTKTETVKQTVSKKQGDRTVSHEVDAVKITYTDENGYTYEATAPIQFTQEQATKAAESEIIAKVADQKANREAKTEYEDKNGNRVIQSNDGWKVVNTEGKEVSTTTARKVHTERLESFDFTKGEDGVAPDAGSDQKAIDREMIATSTNPVQLLDIYERNIEQPSLSTAETIISDHGIGKISKESFEEFSDSNNITMSLARTYFAPKDSKIKPQTLDQVAHELSEDSGIEITPEDVANFMVRFPNGMTSDAKPNDVAGEAAIRFEQVTGFKLDNPANNKRTGIENVVREQQQKKEDEKLTKEEEDLLNLTLKQAEESKQATDEFWAHLADPANEQARKEFLYGRETTEQSEESGQEGTGESTVTQNNPEAEKEEADGSPDKNTDADTEPTARTQEAKGRTVEQKNVQEQLDAANEEYRIAKDAFTAKRKELDETIQSDQEDLFGERKSKNDKSLFDERVDPAAKDKALAPLKARMDKAKAETERLAKNLADLEGKPSAQMDIGDAAKEDATKNNVEEFNKKVDDVADKLIDLLIPKHLRGTSAKGASAESVIRSAAAIIKTAYRLGHDTKVAIQDAIDFIEKNWDAKWGVFDKAATESMMAANFDSYKTKVDVVPQTGSAAKLSEKKFDNALTRSKGNTDSVFKRIKNFFSNLSYWLDNPNRYITEFEKNVYSHYDTKPTSKISLGRVFEQRATGRASYEVRKFVNTVIKGLSKKDIAEFEKYIAAKRVKDRLEQEALNKTFTDSENSRATGNITLQDAVNTLAAMGERLGKDKIKDFERRAAEFQDRMDEALQERVRTGLLSQDDYDKIKSENEFYAPFAVMGHGERYSDGREAALPSTTVGRVQGISYKDGVFTSSPIKAAQAALKSGNITQEQFFNIAIAYLDQQLSTGAISTETYAKEFGALSASGFVIDNIFNKASSLIFNSYTAGHKNELMKRLGDVAKLDKDGVFVKKIDGYDLREIDGQKVMIPKKLSDIKVEEGFGVVGYKDNGKQVFLSINRNAANTINGLDVSEIKRWMKVVNFFNTIFRTSVITLGAAFQAGNLALDIVRNSTLSKYGVFAGKNIQDSITNAILFVPQYMEGLISSGKANLFGKHDELYTEFLKSKGFSSGLYDDLFLNKKKELRSVEPESFFNKLKYGGIDKLFKFIEGIGATFEQTHKLVTFERGMDVEGGIRFGISKWKNLISNAKTPHDMTNALDQVAFEVQNYAGSPNFAATHSGIKTMGVLFQFISARLKGEMADYRRIAALFGGGIDGAKLSKGERAKITAQLATIITPIIYYAIKNNGDDEEEEYMTNSAYDRNNNILIKSGKFEYKNKDGEIETHTDYIKIPLRGLTSTMMVTANAFAQFLKKKNPDEFKKAATISLMNTLPVNIDGDTPDERLESATVGSFTSIPKFLVETAANRNSFTHSDLIYGDYNYGKGSVLQKYNAGGIKPYEVRGKSTPQWAINMSKFLYEEMGIKWTAVGIDHFENTILGNATNQIKPNVVSRKFLRSESTYPVRHDGK